MKFILPLIVTVTAAAIAYGVDLPKMFGAHPWWSQKAVLIGAPIGIVLAAGASLLNLSHITRSIAFILLFAAAFGIAKYGQTQFAASYAEDALAGKLWYFGWMGTAIMASASVFAISNR
ncbi:hypothetical protein [Cochlodiniinecator piscidefendens]|uniref:hypothetical protein n=1 Tax=Cochlodiniinecator piscidefendens TaxID=2715756 RepID=UPI00140C277C|nr:hypothetical protein [Cochlodiniinecator piscidefendens]